MRWTGRIRVEEVIVPDLFRIQFKVKSKLFPSLNSVISQLSHFTIVFLLETLYFDQIMADYDSVLRNLKGDGGDVRRNEKALRYSSIKAIEAADSSLGNLPNIIENYQVREAWAFCNELLGRLRAARKGEPVLRKKIRKTIAAPLLCSLKVCDIILTSDVSKMRESLPAAEFEALLEPGQLARACIDAAFKADQHFQTVSHESISHTPDAAQWFKNESIEALMAAFESEGEDKMICSAVYYVQEMWQAMVDREERYEEGNRVGLYGQNGGNLKGLDFIESFVKVLLAYYEHQPVTASIDWETLGLWLRCEISKKRAKWARNDPVNA